MKRIIIMSALLAFCTMRVQPQDVNAVYSSTKTPVCISTPASRTLYGGTVIIPNYIGNERNVAMENAFDHACRLVEEVMPTTYPIHVNVDYGTLPNGHLAYVTTPQSPQGIDDTDRIYYKRYSQQYGYDLYAFQNDEDSALCFYKDEIDATIKFARNAPFSYNIDPTGLNSNKYDFITVAIQALLKAVGFTCKTACIEDSLFISGYNQFTKTCMTNNPRWNYSWATSNNARIMGQHSNNSWKLRSNPVYQHGVSLCYFEDSNNQETAIMQYGISKGSYIRHIGTALTDFFSYCGWDNVIAVGNFGTTINTTNTTNVLPYQGSNADSSNETNHLRRISTNEEDESFDEYMRKRSEIDCEDGDYVLLADGAWQRFQSLRSLTGNSEYMRSPDGYLRLKHVETHHGAGQYSNKHTTYQLYKYPPQNPEAAMRDYQISDWSIYIPQSHSRANRVLSNDDIFIDVNIDYKNVDGATQILVRQVDYDYPQPYSYYLDEPKKGTFTAFMNKRYPSAFTLIYMNECGQTIGEPLVIDLTADTDAVRQDINISTTISSNNIAYHVEGNGNSPLDYSIANLSDGTISRRGRINNEMGNIDISSLSKGQYVFTVYDGNKKVKEWKWNH